MSLFAELPSIIVTSAFDSFSEKQAKELVHGKTIE